jgi:hypothetical protein
MKKYNSLHFRPNSYEEEIERRNDEGRRGKRLTSIIHEFDAMCV